MQVESTTSSFRRLDIRVECHKHGGEHCYCAMAYDLSYCITNQLYHIVFFHTTRTEIFICITVNEEFFDGKIICRLNFCVVLSLSFWPLDEINLFYLFVQEIFHRFNFCQWRWSIKFFQGKNFPIYGNKLAKTSVTSESHSIVNIP